MAPARSAQLELQSFGERLDVGEPDVGDGNRPAASTATGSDGNICQRPARRASRRGWAVLAQSFRVRTDGSAMGASRSGQATRGW